MFLLAASVSAGTWLYPTNGVRRVVVAPVEGSTNDYPYSTMECRSIVFMATPDGGVAMMAQVGWSTDGVGYRQRVEK